MGGTSQKQVEANRRNARKSTGPRTEQGKRRSRANGLRHGLAAEVLVPEEERAAYETALARWEREAGPDNVVEAQLIRRAAVASVRLERIERANEEAREQAARRAVGGWERRMQARARKAGQRLRVDPVGAVEELEASGFGCDWLIRQWRTLEAKLRQGWTWGRTEVHAAQLLLGLPVMVPGPCGDPASRRLWGLAARANPSGVEEPPASPSGDQDDWPRPPGESWRALRDFVAEQIDRLFRLRDEAWEAVEGPECAAVARLAASADVSPEGQLRHRYEASAERSCNAAIRLFLNLRDRRRKELLAIAKEAAALGDTPKAPVGGGWWREADSAPAPPGFGRLEPTSADPTPAEAPVPEARPLPTPPEEAPTSAPPPGHRADRASPGAPQRSEAISGGASPPNFGVKSSPGNDFGVGGLVPGRGDDRRTDPDPMPIGSPGSAPNPGEPRVNGMSRPAGPSPNSSPRATDPRRAP